MNQRIFQILTYIEVSSFLSWNKYSNVFLLPKIYAIFKLWKLFIFNSCTALLATRLELSETILADFCEAIELVLQEWLSRRKFVPTSYKQKSLLISSRSCIFIVISRKPEAHYKSENYKSSIRWNYFVVKVFRCIEKHAINAYGLIYSHGCGIGIF